MQHFQMQGPSLQERLTERTTKLVKTINDFFEVQQVPDSHRTFRKLLLFRTSGGRALCQPLLLFPACERDPLARRVPMLYPTALTDADIETVVAAFKESVREMQAAGFFAKPGPAD